MKRIIVVAILLLLCFSIFSNAQSAGISAYLLGSSIHYPQHRDNYASSPRTMEKTNGFSPGLRLEANLMTPERRVFHNSAIGFSYYFPHRDSTFYYSNLVSNSAVRVFGTFKTSSIQANIRSSYNLPFNFEFLTIHVGIAYGLIQYKTQYFLPEKSASFNHEPSDFNEPRLIPQKSYGISTELLAGGLYEFEKFYLLAQYCLIFETANTIEPPVRHSLHLGIYYPIKKW